MMARWTLDRRLFDYDQKRLAAEGVELEREFVEYKLISLPFVSEN